MASLSPKFDGKDQSTTPTMNQIQYRSYAQELKVYHFPTTLYNIDRFTEHCTDANTGFVKHLISPPMSSQRTPNDDEVPEDKIEVVYIPGAYTVTVNGTMSKVRGSALGFSTTDMVIWFTFSNPIDEHLENLAINMNGNLVQGGDVATYTPLFDLVGRIERKKNSGNRRGKDNSHREWFELLDEAARDGITGRERLAKICEQWEMFRRAGYDVRKSGYTR
ncbi:hypothetical protein DM02DRAFT_688964 [Periconia macrospinosa]|uniref:Uncharacterized protein n=1 Tax=Periconia macrospinosa TaxID=97972 RepID=A0A2V1E339_9PLEO|nr:hypothetical protein DM02DRAFT_688964 [Periconia macrospinosa]